LDTNGNLKLVTKKLGSAPLLKHFIDKMGVIPIIDSLVEKHPNRKINHGEAVAALLVYLLNDGRALYQMENWANEEALLTYLFPKYQPGDWTDDRLADTLDAIYNAGLEILQGSISGNIITEFSLKLSEIHYDTTSVSFWGTYDSRIDEPAIVITFGYSKDHRPDLKQIVVGAAVSGDGGVPILSGTHDGNTNDSVLPVPYWERLRKLANKNDFCFIGDCKIASQKTIKELCANNGKFLSPLPMSVKMQSDLIELLKQDKIEYEELELELEEELLPIYEHELYQKTSKTKKKRNRSIKFASKCGKSTIMVKFIMSAN
jgi:Transposase